MINFFWNSMDILQSPFLIEQEDECVCVVCVLAIAGAVLSFFEADRA